MAKTINKSNQKKKDSPKIRNGKIEKHINGVKLRDCVVKMKKMSEKEIEMYCNPHYTVTKTFSMKLSNKQLGIDNEKYRSDNNTFNFVLKMCASDLVLECRNAAEIIGHQQTVVEQKVTPALAKPLNSLINEAWTN